MSWLTIVRVVVVWYVVVQLVMLATLPLTLRVLRALPDRGYSLAKISGVLLVGVVYWLAYSYGLLRNERGGAWVALVATASVSWALGWGNVVVWWKSLRHDGKLAALVTVEVLFAVAFVGWALVRAYDPNADHTEQPMDLMFINSIWASSTFPPQDAWFAGYAISYYYFGYWLLATLGRLANTLPNVAYNVGQAVWYGYLWVGCFGIVTNLLAWRFGRAPQGELSDVVRLRIPKISMVGGILAGVTVAFVGNLQVIFEWLYAQGYNISGIAAWINVHNFPENASQTGLWYIDSGWWWWRSSRVIEDIDLLGNHIDISPIDEFPMFSYLLGDNHPHVMAMPIVLLVIGLALNFLLLLVTRPPVEDAQPSGLPWRWLPLPAAEMAIYIAAVGSLVFLNTWDFPPYWLLVVAVVLLGGGRRWKPAFSVGALLIAGTVLLYLPYFLTAQSQAGGIVPNLFNPTRLPQFLVMFGGMLPAVAGMVILAWRLTRPSGATLVWSAALVMGVPALFLAVSTAFASTASAREGLPALELPPGAGSYAEVIAQRWLSEPWTFLFVGVLLTLLFACLVTLTQWPHRAWVESVDLVFVMLMGTIGLALVYAPEFVFLRDNFGSRMNTVFKFYYQGWLLLGLATAYMLARAWPLGRRESGTSVDSRFGSGFGTVQILSLVSALLLAGSAIYPVAGVYAKTGGFSRTEPTLDATDYVADNLPDVMAAADWVRLNTTPDQIVLEGKGNSYAAHHNRISTMTGRPTLLGWDGHESQWRGEAYGSMAQGRPGDIERIYRTAPPDEISAILDEWDIDYVFIGPTEIEQYGITPVRLEELAEELDTVFARGQTRIFRRREG